MLSANDTVAAAISAAAARRSLLIILSQLVYCVIGSAVRRMRLREIVLPNIRLLADNPKLSLPSPLSPMSPPYLASPPSPASLLYPTSPPYPASPPSLELSTPVSRGILTITGVRPGVPLLPLASPCIPPSPSPSPMSASFPRRRCTVTSQHFLDAHIIAVFSASRS